MVLPGSHEAVSDPGSLAGPDAEPNRRLMSWPHLALSPFSWSCPILITLHQLQR